jgi:hypothetical protein
MPPLRKTYDRAIECGSVAVFELQLFQKFRPVGMVWSDRDCGIGNFASSDRFVASNTEF